MFSPKILLIDDNPDHRCLLANSLSEYFDKVDIQMLSCADEFASRIGSEHFDCIILDFKLGDTTAAELLDKHGSELSSSSTPAMIISSSREQSVAISSFRSGSVDFIHKSDAFDSQQLGTRVSTAIKQANTVQVERRRQQEMARQVESDELTGLFNRRKLDRMFSRDDFKRDRRLHSCCALIDIDHFKDINDRYGHASGDEVLRQVAATIKKSCEAGNIPVRWGGEEFLIFRHSNSALDSWLWANALRKDVEANPKIVQEIENPVTISIGLRNFKTADMGNEIIKQADQAMYLAKQTGRNRVCSWPMTRAWQLAETIGRDQSMTLEQKRDELLAQCGDVLTNAHIQHIRRHSDRVCDYINITARSAGLSDEEISRLATAAYLHDLGMLAVAEQLLEYPGSLDQKQRELIDMHADFSAELSLQLGADAEMASWIRYHHQPFSSFHSGSRAGRFVSLLAAADSLAAMTESRSYRSPIKPQKAINELKNMPQQRFDRQTIKAMCKARHEYASEVA